MLDRAQADKMRRLLSYWGNTVYYVRRKEDEIAQFRAAIGDAYSTLGAQNLDGMPRSSRAHSSVERAAEAAQHRIGCYEEALERIQDEIDRALALKAAVDEVVDGLDVAAQRVLALKYKDRHQWAFIGLKLNYDERHVKRLEYEALVKMSRNVLFDVL